MTKEMFRKHRTRLGLTQAQLAAMIGRHSNTIARYESGELPIPQIVAIALQSISPKNKPVEK